MTVIFDLDGTLIDSAPDIQAAANTVLSEAGARPIDLAEARSFIGEGAPVFVSRMMTATGLGDDPALHAALLERFLSLYDTAVVLTRPFPGVAEALEALRSRGWRLGICTNKPAGLARAVLAHLGLAPFFDVVVGGDSLPERKPHPAPLLQTMKSLSATRCLYVGDSEIDAACAHAARLPFAIFTEGYRKTPVESLPHDYRFSDFAALPDIAEVALRAAAE
ncbi:MAG: phosphoglycolate phosphatase [Alphaproteobacteria bacterium]|nr:MAG: phosphoglycolate phosphatase [Alphaproteobacteria bacterium]